MFLKRKKLLLEVCWAVMSKTSSANKQNLFFHIIATHHNLHWPQTVTA